MKRGHLGHCTHHDSLKEAFNLISCHGNILFSSIYQALTLKLLQFPLIPELLLTTLVSLNSAAKMQPNYYFEEYALLPIKVSHATIFNQIYDHFFSPIIFFNT